MKNKTSSLKIGIGTPTLLMIFVVLCMVILAVLSYMEANMNANLSDKEKIYTENYYDAQTKADLIYHSLSQNDKNIAEISSLYDINIVEADKNLTFDVSIDKQKQLYVAIDKDDLVTINAWKVVSKEDK